MTSPYALSTELISGVAVITIDLPGEPVNKVNRQLKDEFVALFDRLERDLNERSSSAEKKTASLRARTSRSFSSSSRRTRRNGSVMKGSCFSTRFMRSVPRS
jgi:hypothetical protein